jgi:hypothetical protein
MKIKRYAFYSGLNTLKLSYETQPRLQRLISSIFYFISGAGFRSRYERNKIKLSGRFALNIRLLGELVDAYHTCKATNRLDKVYALLGMSSDDASESLSANYNALWGEIF